MAEPEARTTIVGSCVQFRINYEQIKQLPIGKAVFSDVVSAGGHCWRTLCYPHGIRVADKGEYISIFLVHISKARSVRAKLEVFMMGGDGKSSTSSDIKTICETFDIAEGSDTWGWYKFMKLTDVEKYYLTEGHVTFACIIMVVDESAILVPPSDIGTHLGRLLDRTDGSDVSFTVDGEKFPAHRVVLAARSPVFRAELFGSMAEATMSSITLHDIKPATFKAMLQFIYTDELPSQDDLEDSSIEMFQNLLAAADRYALDRLKFICAQKLWEKVSVDTVATILASAETYNCHELKNNCIDFFAVEKNFKKAIFTDGYALLVLKFPSITAELKKRVKEFFLGSFRRTSTSKPEGVKYELHTLPVNAKAVADGDKITMYVDMVDPRETPATCPMKFIAAAERVKAQEAKKYQKADTLQKIIADAGYRQVRNWRGEQVLAKKYRIRLRGIDAPEKSMPYGKEAKEELVKLVQGKALKVAIYDTDQYGRLVGDVHCNGFFVQGHVLKKGLAWHYTAYDRRLELANWENQARVSRLGLWALPNPEKPWEWRKEKHARKWL